MHALSLRQLTFSFLFLLLSARLLAASDFDSAVTLFRAKRYPEACAAFQKIAEHEPQNAAAHYYLGRIAIYRDDAYAAAAELEKAAAGDPKNSDYFFWLGSAYGLIARQNYSIFKAYRCRNTLLKAIDLNPDNLQARYELVTYYRQAPFFAGGSLAKAHAQAKEIARRDPLLGAEAEGEICISEKNYDEAVATFEKLLHDHPDQVVALYQIGFIAATTGEQLGRGEAALKEYLKHTPGDTQPSLAYAHYRLGDIYRQKDETDAARKEYQAALALDPNLKTAAKALEELE
jgi:tetratricopeptide (TPR) repeat protein